MNTRYLLRKFGGFVFAILMLAGVMAVSGTEAQAQRRGRVIIVRPYYRPFYRPFYWHPYGYNNYYYSQYVFSNSEDAMDQGYKDGYKTGRDDGKKDKSYSYERSHYFHDAGFGNFAEAYRRAFARGYDEGYRDGGAG